jgi:adenylylsulfate kinase
MKHAAVFWFTGLSGSGKTTVAEAAAGILSRRKDRVKILDGDAVRGKVTRHLGFSPEDIAENNMTIAALCRDYRREYDYIFVPVISPFTRLRAETKAAAGEPFYLVYCSASLEAVEKRDPKGLYRRSQEGKMTGLIGVDKLVPYEAPDNADLVLDTGKDSIESCVNKFMDFLESKKVTES